MQFSCATGCGEKIICFVNSFEECFLVTCSTEGSQLSHLICGIINKISNDKKIIPNMKKEVFFELFWENFPLNLVGARKQNTLFFCDCFYDSLYKK